MTDEEEDDKEGVEAERGTDEAEEGAAVFPVSVPGLPSGNAAVIGEGSGEGEATLVVVGGRGGRRAAPGALGDELSASR